MANLDHLEILKRGVEAWNAWRQRDRAIEPDLSGVYFMGPRMGDITLDPPRRYKRKVEATLIGVEKP